MTSWDGKERRQSMFDREFYDKMMEVHSDVKHLVEHVAAHIKEDKASFAKIEKDQVWTNKIIYGGLGIVAFIEFVSNFIK